ncbi:MAG: lysophospholipid acyltransferase family protein [Cellvibrionaceae bacterium]
MADLSNKLSSTLVDPTLVNPVHSNPPKTNILAAAEGTGAHHYSKLNHFLRGIGHAFIWALFGIGAPILTLALLALYCLPLERSHKITLTRKAISFSCRFYLNSMRFLKLMTYTIKPESTINVKGKLIIANHPSLLDAFFILGMCPNLCCIAKEALWKNPYTAFIVRMADYIHNGTDDFIEQAKKRLEKGENILIFPEGTRNAYDDQLDFKRGAANIAILAECDILPILIECYPRAMQKGEKPYSIPTVAPLFAFTHLPIIETQAHIDSNTPKTVQYRALTRFLKELYRPLLSKQAKPHPTEPVTAKEAKEKR